MFACHFTCEAELGKRNWKAKSWTASPFGFQLMIGELPPGAGSGMSAGVAMGKAVPCAYACEPTASAAAPANPDNSFASRRRDNADMKCSLPVLGVLTDGRIRDDPCPDRKVITGPEAVVTPFVTQIGRQRTARKQNARN